MHLNWALTTRTTQFVQAIQNIAQHNIILHVITMCPSCTLTARTTQFVQAATRCAQPRTDKQDAAR